MSRHLYPSFEERGGQLMTAVFDTSASLVDRIRSQVGDLNDQIEYGSINLIFLRELDGWINTMRIPKTNHKTPT